MLLIAFATINRPIAIRLERNFRLAAAIGTSYLVHLSFSIHLYFLLLGFIVPNETRLVKIDSSI